MVSSLRRLRTVWYSPRQSYNLTVVLIIYDAPNEQRCIAD